MPEDRGKRGHYLLSVKDNQPTLKQDIADLWEEDIPPQAVQVSTHGDRVEVRRLWASAELVNYSDWPHLAQVCRTERIVHHKGKTRRELAYAVTSLSPQQAGPARLLELWRGHWGIENRVFWVRDVTMDEDRSQVRTGSDSTNYGWTAQSGHQSPSEWERKQSQHRHRSPSLRYKTRLLPSPQ